MMSNELRNRTVVITGASAGVGRAAAHRFARAGARVAMIARDKDALNDVKNEIERLGGGPVLWRRPMLQIRIRFF
jgi:NADP-dependent 3-hydroxy acid dehydrogenase YdfG